jgi:tRNA G18 (ribose-2'-O)-methylase SpoU
VTNLKNEEFWVIAMENGIKAKDWYKIDYSGKMLVIVGSEGRGIKKLVLESSDFQATIPMQGKTSSLNVSAAVSAVLFERLRQLSA